MADGKKIILFFLSVGGCKDRHQLNDETARIKAKIIKNVHGKNWPIGSGLFLSFANTDKIYLKKSSNINE